jgi:hypothetical protein
MEDRAGVRGAAKEIRQHQYDELGRPDCLTHGHAGLRLVVRGGTGIPDFQGRRTAYQQRHRDHHDCNKGSDDLERRSPVIEGDEPSRQGRHGHWCHSHAGGDERNGQAAVCVEPACYTGHHRHEDCGGRASDQKAPQAMLANAIARKPIVMAPDTPIMDHPVSREIGKRKTGSENIAPIAMQPNRPPAATITQR